MHQLLDLFHESNLFAVKQNHAKFFIKEWGKNWRALSQTIHILFGGQTLNQLWVLLNPFDFAKKSNLKLLCSCNLIWRKNLKSFLSTFNWFRALKRKFITLSDFFFGWRKDKKPQHWDKKDWVKSFNNF